MVIQESDKKAVAEFLSGMDKRVTALFFKSDGDSCKFCDQIHDLLKELSQLGDEFCYEMGTDEDMKKFGIKYAPAIIFKERPNIRFLGIPGGYEFKVFLNTILMVSNQKVELNEQLKHEVQKIDSQVDIKVFVTPTCPYCTGAVMTAHKLAMLNPKIVSNMVESIEFRTLAGKHRVMAVPKTVINDKIEFEGSVPEDIFVKKLKEAL
ncbi:MAG: glutaredoxin [Candidatus Altiarchaeota archaeon]|nr:glutaredoxin [Candidatus Altiarchaeota archaeon]